MMNAGGMNHTPDNEPSHAPIAHRGSFTRLWQLFVTLWLVFIVPGPVATMLALPLSPPRMLMALAWTAAFGAAYLWLMLYKPFRETELTATERRVQIGLLLILTLLVLLPLLLPSLLLQVVVLLSRCLLLLFVLIYK